MENGKDFVRNFNGNIPRLEESHELFHQLPLATMVMIFFFKENQNQSNQAKVMSTLPLAFKHLCLSVGHKKCPKGLQK